MSSCSSLWLHDSTMPRLPALRTGRSGAHGRRPARTRPSPKAQAETPKGRGGGKVRRTMTSACARAVGARPLPESSAGGSARLRASCCLHARTYDQGCLPTSYLRALRQRPKAAQRGPGKGQTQWQERALRGRGQGEGALRSAGEPACASVGSNLVSAEALKYLL